MTTPVPHSTDSAQGSDARGPEAPASDIHAAESHLPWVVAVGASAGGLEALQRFFGAARRPTNAAFVVIQHLAPDHRSMMAELLTRHTELPVHEAQAGEALQPDQVYLMPPGVLMTIEQDRLVFEPRPQHGVSLPIDQFFRSLAAKMPQRAVGIVLSGSGSDGSAGAAALRAAGGFVLAQTPDTAKFDSMPRSVIAATAVDAVMAPEDLARKAADLSQGRAGRIAQGEIVSLAESRPALQRLFDALLQHAQIDFAQYKLPTVMRRIERRMTVLGCASVSEYAERVEDSPDECEALRRELLIPVTGFFRDPAAYAALAPVLEQLVRQCTDGRMLRIWCAGCATGEEAYSLAMAALEACAVQQRWPGIKIFATDVDARFLSVGTTGSYPLGAADGMAPERVSQFFTRLDDRLLVKPELRQMVLFARHNLLEDAPFTKMDLVVCRNVLIYFRAEPQERVMRRLQYALNAGGVLFLGHSESLGGLQPDFQALDSAHKIYRLVRPVLTALAVREGFGRSMLSPVARRGARAAAEPGIHQAVAAAQQELLQRYVPLALLLGSGRQLLHAWGPTQRYLRLPQGQPSLDPVAMLPPRLGALAVHALQQAQREGGSYTAPPLAVALDGETVSVKVVARRLNVGSEGDGDGASGSMLLIFEEQGPLAGALPEAETLAEAELDRIALLEQELAESRESLQSTIEELETANEEMQATNEELMSSNEELQSTNEELQSVNEELYTVNAEYNAKLDVVSALMADIDGMSQATGIATLFVDHKLALVRFTPEATLLFRLRATDVGRAITDFTSLLDYPELVDDLRAAVEGAAAREREVPGPNGLRYLARVIGYGEVGSPGRRTVLSLIDISRLKDAQRLQTLIDSLPEHIALLDRMGNIRQVNHAWESFARANAGPSGTAATQGVGSNYLAVVARANTPDAAELLHGLQQVLAGTRPSLRVTYPCHGPDEQRWFVMHACALRGVGGDGGAVVTHFDVTPWRSGEVPLHG